MADQERVDQLNRWIAENDEAAGTAAKRRDELMELKGQFGQADWLDPLIADFDAAALQWHKANTGLKAFRDQVANGLQD